MSDALRCLTDRERACADLVVRGLTDDDIAGRLFLSRTTVKGHLHAARRKLGVRNRVELAVVALGHGDVLDRERAPLPARPVPTSKPKGEPKPRAAAGSCRCAYCGIGLSGAPADGICGFCREEITGSPEIEVAA